MSDYLNTLKKAVSEGKSFSLKFYILDDPVEKKIESVINELFNYYGKSEYAGVIYTCIKELIINGAKANLKRVLFDINNLNIDDKNEYLKGMMSFRNMLDERSFKEHLKDLKERGFWLTVHFNHNAHGIRIEVINSVQLTKIEDSRLREKLKKAMSYEDIAQFYLEQGDEIEGAGMGVALIVMLIKGMEIDPSLFRVGNNEKNKTTVGRLEIPFDNQFVSIRNASID